MTYENYEEEKDVSQSPKYPKSPESPSCRRIDDWEDENRSEEGYDENEEVQKGRGGQEGQKDNNIDSEFIEYYKDKDNLYKTLLALYPDRKLTQQEISNKSGVSPDNIKKIFQRGSHNISIFTEVSKEGRLNYYKLSEKGKYKLDNEYKEHLEKNRIPKPPITTEVLQHELSQVENFLETHKDKIVPVITTGSKSFELNFYDIANFDPDLGFKFEEKPEEMIKLFEIASENKFDHELTPRVKGLPPISCSEVKDIKNLDRFISLQGDVRVKKEPEISVHASYFECPSCESMITILQTGLKLKSPSRCSCGRKGRFLHRKDLDIKRLMQKAILNESLSDIDYDRPPTGLNIILPDDLAKGKANKITRVGNKIRISGILQAQDKYDGKGVELREKDFVIWANHVELADEDYSELNITEQDIKKFQEVKEDMLRDVLETYGSIQGLGDLKIGLLLQQTGGERKILKNGKIVRDTIHIMVVGEGSLGKSDLNQITRGITPKCRTITGSGTSAIGLIGCVRRDNFLGDYVVDGGAIVSANNGLLIIDEADKINEKDREAMHEPMENHTVTINKANIQAVLPAHTSILMMGNPKDGRFDDHTAMYNQIGFLDTLMQRCDLIYVIKDIPNEDKDKRIAEKIVNRLDEESSSMHSSQFIKKYIAYARRTKPKLLKPQQDKIIDFYTSLRRKSRRGESFLIVPRHLEGLMRLSIASAKWRLAEIVEDRDVNLAISLVENMFNNLGLNEEGRMDVDTIVIGQSNYKRKNKEIVREIIISLSESDPLVPVESIIQTAKQKEVKESVAEFIIEEMKGSGEIFSPKSGFIKIL